MKFMEDKIRTDGIILSGQVVKVDSFLNHQIDVPFMLQVGQAFYDYFGGRKIDKILTVESSGIGVACLAATFFKVPVLYAKKYAGSNMSEDVYSTTVFSYTHQKLNEISVAKEYLQFGEHILLIDDFLANGASVTGLIQLCAQAGAMVQGIGIAVEKGFQGGGDRLRETGHEVLSLAIIDSMNAETGTFQFRPDKH